MPTYSKADRRAIIVLAIAACLIIACIALFGTKEQEGKGDVGHETHDARKSHVPSNPRDLPDAHGARPLVAPPTSFDPNTVDSLTLLDLGLSPKQVRTWMRYRRAGGQFREPSDIARLYSLTEEDVERLLPLVSLPEERTAQHDRQPRRPSGGPPTDHAPIDGNGPHMPGQRPSDLPRPPRSNHPVSDPSRPPKFTSPTTVEVNTADTALLQRIPGVGSHIARWIVERRNRLGGFHSLQQLTEIRHVDAGIMKWLTVDSTAVRKIQISNMPFSEMSRFPYIGYDKAKAISNYIRIYGPIKSEEDLRSTHLFTDEELSRLLPYCEF